MTFLAPKMVKMTLSEGPILALNFDFRGHISTFQAENNPKTWPFKTKNNAQTTSDQLQNNYINFQKTTFVAPKMVKMTLSKGQILT